MHPIPALPLARSLGGNMIGVKGVTALAAILNTTKITNLECAAAPKRLSMPIDAPTLSPFPSPAPRSQSLIQ